MIQLLRPLQLVSPLLQPQLDCQQLPVPYVVVVFHRGEFAGENGTGMHLIILSVVLGEHLPHFHIRCVNVHEELLGWVRKRGIRSIREQRLISVQMVMHLTVHLVSRRQRQLSCTESCHAHPNCTGFSVLLAVLDALNRAEDAATGTWDAGRQ